ncbi:uncharacterized protein LOC110986729 [Acanthaster planci]|uniref:Uncharacterized protein LOC110986729 n=1 Tax=Acanthaster planci TaxID=133434 RepID=A0A8B7ZG37_ACAPL|nr:uncharacterized protein LOC110986729 [Acanthaster planci]
MFFWFIFAFALAMALSQDAHLDKRSVAQTEGEEVVLKCQELYQSSPPYELTVKLVHLEDEGLYYCNLCSGTHVNTLETFKLTVSPLSRCEFHAKMLPPGTKARLECTLSAMATPNRQTTDSDQALSSQTQTSAPTLPGGNYTSVSSHTPNGRGSVQVSPEAATSVNPTPKSFRDSYPDQLWLKVGGAVTLCLLVIVCFVAVTRCIRRRKKKQKVLISQNDARVLCASPTEPVPEKQSCRYEDHPSVMAARAESAVYFTVSGEDTALSPGDRSKATTACDAEPTYCNVSRRRENFLPKWKLLPFPDPTDSRQ